MFNIINEKISGHGFNINNELQRMENFLRRAGNRKSTDTDYKDLKNILKHIGLKKVPLEKDAEGWKDYAEKILEVIAQIIPSTEKIESDDEFEYKVSSVIVWLLKQFYALNKAKKVDLGPEAKGQKIDRKKVEVDYGDLYKFLIEDSQRMTDILSKFNQYKLSPKLELNPNIMDYPNYQSLIDAVLKAKKIDDKIKASKQVEQVTDNQVLNEIYSTPDATVLYQGDKFVLVETRTYKANKAVGFAGATKAQKATNDSTFCGWCTAYSSSDNFFNNYATSNGSYLYIIKNFNGLSEAYQIEFCTPDCRNVHDGAFSTKKLFDKDPGIYEALKNHQSTILGFKNIMKGFVNNFNNIYESRANVDGRTAKVDMKVSDFIDYFVPENKEILKFLFSSKSTLNKEFYDKYIIPNLQKIDISDVFDYVTIDDEELIIEIKKLLKKHNVDLGNKSVEEYLKTSDDEYAKLIKERIIVSYKSSMCLVINSILKTAFKLKIINNGLIDITRADNIQNVSIVFDADNPQLQNFIFDICCLIHVEKNERKKDILELLPKDSLEVDFEKIIKNIIDYKEIEEIAGAEEILRRYRINFPILAVQEID